MTRDDVIKYGFSHWFSGANQGERSKHLRKKITVRSRALWFE